MSQVFQPRILIFFTNNKMLCHVHHSAAVKKKSLPEPQILNAHIVIAEEAKN